MQAAQAANPAAYAAQYAAYARQGMPDDAYQQVAPQEYQQEVQVHTLSSAGTKKSL